MRSGQLSNTTLVTAAAVDEQSGVATLQLRTSKVRSWSEQCSASWLVCLQLSCSAAAASSLTNLSSAILPAHAVPCLQSLGCPVRELFLLVPAISRWQWHPITVAGAEADPSGTGSLLTLHIKRYGRWTVELLRLLKRSKPLALRVSGTLAPSRHARCMHGACTRSTDGWCLHAGTLPADCGPQFA